MSQLTLMLRFETLISYQGPDTHIVSCNLSLALLNANVIQQKLSNNLLAGCIISATQTSPFISLLLGLVPKSNGEFRQIHYLLFFCRSLINDYIPKEVVNLKYATLKNILAQIHPVGRGAIIMKKDIKNAFQNIPMATHQQWLLRFQ